MELGFLSFVPNHGGPENAGRALRDGVELFEWAEQLGLDAGWVRVRHFEPFLSSPLTFLAAVSQRTSRIRLGTGVIPMRYEDPIRLAEDAATLDLLSGGRLELGLSGGIAGLAPILDGVFGRSDRTFSDEAQHRIARLRAALSGNTLAHSGKGFMSVPADTELTLSPRSPGLLDRLWYGPGTLATARRTGEQGLDLQVSTLNGEDTGEAFEATQAAQIRAYKQEFAASGAVRAPRVAAGRIILPLLTPEDEAQHRGFIDFYNARMDPDGRPRDGKIPMRFGRIHCGSPEQITEGLLADEALAEATQLIITLPAPGDAASHRRVLEAVATKIAPRLGWEPATAVNR